MTENITNALVIISMKPETKDKFKTVTNIYDRFFLRKYWIDFTRFTIFAKNSGTYVWQDPL